MQDRKITRKAAIDEALREGIPRIGNRQGESKPLVMPTFPLGLKPGIDPDKIGQYADELEYIEKMRKSAW